MGMEGKGRIGTKREDEGYEGKVLREMREHLTPYKEGRRARKIKRSHSIYLEMYLSGTVSDPPKCHVVV